MCRTTDREKRVVYRLGGSAPPSKTTLEGRPHLPRHVKPTYMHAHCAQPAFSSPEPLAMPERHKAVVGCRLAAPPRRPRRRWPRRRHLRKAAALHDLAVTGASAMPSMHTNTGPFVPACEDGSRPLSCRPGPRRTRLVLTGRREAAVTQNLAMASASATLWMGTSTAPFVPDVQNDDRPLCAR